MTKIFISYRRDDTKAEAGRLYDRLIKKYGENNVFWDYEHIAAGHHFRRVITRAITECNIMLVMIGDEWLTDRLNDYDDYVRYEIRLALDLEKHLIPILVDNTIMPSKDELPSDIDQLTYNNAITLRHDDQYENSIDYLLQQLPEALLEDLNNELGNQKKKKKNTLSSNTWLWIITIIGIILASVAIGISVTGLLKNTPETYPDLFQTTAWDSSLCLTTGDTDQQASVRELIYSINNYRTINQMAPMVFNDDLCTVAYEHALDIATRPSSNLNLSQRAPDGTGLDDWLTEIGFSTYPNNEIHAELLAFVSQSHGVEDLITYFVANQPNFLEFAASEYREIGIAYRYNAVSEIHYYVFIGASRPNVIPISVVNHDEPSIPLSQISNPEVEIWLQSEEIVSTGSTNIIGNIRFVRISQGFIEDACPSTLPDSSWQLYNYKFPYTVQPEGEITTISVQMCDSLGRSVISSYQLEILSLLANFSTQLGNDTYPLTISFLNESLNAVRYEWDFDNDHLVDSYEENPSFTYDQSGTYSITLIAYSDEGESSSVTREVEVTEP